MNPIEINENKTNKLEWKKARKLWKDFYPYVLEYNPIGPKPEQVKQIYKLNKIKENLETCLKNREEIKSYSQTLVMLIDLILQIIKVRHDNIIYRLCKTAVYKEKRERIIKDNENIDLERQKIIDTAKSINPNVRVPGEVKTETENKETEYKEEEKKEEENKEEKKEEEIKENKELISENKNIENKEEKKEPEKEEEKKEIETGENKESGEQNEEEDKDESDSAKLAEDLMIFDEENPKKEVPPDIEYDIDNDYDIDQNEKDTEINNALQKVNYEELVDKDREKNKTTNSVNNNPLQDNPSVNNDPQAK